MLRKVTSDRRLLSNPAVFTRHVKMPAFVYEEPPPSGGTTHTFTFIQSNPADPNTYRRLFIDGNAHPEILPGDTIELDMGALTYVKSLEIVNLHGSATFGRINIRNKTGQQLIFDNTPWVLANGWGTAFKMEQCTHFNVTGVGFGGEGIYSQGPTGAERSNFFHYQFLEKSYEFDLGFVASDDGGTGVQIKTFVENADPSTWRGTGPDMPNVVVHDIHLRDTGNEAMYIGDTAIYYDISGPSHIVWQPPTVSTPFPSDPSNFKRVLKYTDMVIYNININGSGNDALQFANIDGLEIYDCVINNWATNQEGGHLGGILIGGGVTNSYVHDCTMQNSIAGEGIWHFGEGPGHLVENVLVYNAGGNLCFIKGGEHLVPDSNFQITFNNVSFILNPSWAVGVRINGIMGGTTPHLFNNCLFAEVGHGGFNAGPRKFYVENGAQFTEGSSPNGNLSFTTITAAGLDVNNFCQPIEPGSPVGDEGYRIANQSPVAAAGSDQTITLPTSSVTLNASGSTDADGTISTYAWTKISGGPATIASPSASSTSVTGLIEGTYVFRVTVTDDDGATGTDDITVRVNPVTPTIRHRMREDQFKTNSAGSTTAQGLTFVPTDYTDTANLLPVIIFFHGAGEAGTGSAALDTLAGVALPKAIRDGLSPAGTDGTKFIVCCPQANNSWSHNMGTGIEWVLNDILARYRVDPTRVYITGLSAGGSSCLALTCNGSTIANKITAMYPIANAGFANGTEDANWPSQAIAAGVKLWAVAGQQDGIKNQSSGLVTRYNAGSPAVAGVYTELIGAQYGHNAATWDLAYSPSFTSNVHGKNVYDWFLQYTG